MASFSPSEKCYAAGIYPEQEQAMDKQFTASEVRANAAYRRKTEPELAAMLYAFADMLEAREKAEPVMVVNHVSSAEHDLPIGMKLYTHLAPADVERLAEALRRTCRKMKTFSRTGALDGAVAVWVDEIEAVLAAHSAQAQPPAASVPDICTMVNRFLSWRLPKPWNPDNGISYTRPNYAHEPAEHDWPTGTNLFDAHQAREMVEYMLAAQENPNG